MLAEFDAQGVLAIVVWGLSGAARVVAEVVEGELWQHARHIHAVGTLDDAGGHCSFRGRCWEQSDGLWPASGLVCLLGGVGVEARLHASQFAVDKVETTPPPELGNGKHHVQV